jgi:hypothetical protein
MRSSSVMRTFEERVALRKLSRQVLTMHVSGYVFFASSVRLLREAKASILASEEQLIMSPSTPPRPDSPKKRRSTDRGTLGVDTALAEVDKMRMPTTPIHTRGFERTSSRRSNVSPTRLSDSKQVLSKSPSLDRGLGN